MLPSGAERRLEILLKSSFEDSSKKWRQIFRWAYSDGRNNRQGERQKARVAPFFFNAYFAFAATIRHVGRQTALGSGCV